MSRSPSTSLCSFAKCPDLIQIQMATGRQRWGCRAQYNKIPGNLATCPTGYLDRKLTRGTDPEGVE